MSTESMQRQTPAFRRPLLFLVAVGLCIAGGVQAEEASPAPVPLEIPGEYAPGLPPSPPFPVSWSIPPGGILPAEGDPAEPVPPFASDPHELYSLEDAGPAGEWRPIGGLGSIDSPTTIYDPIGNRIILFGGVKGGTTGTLSNETWELKLDGVSSWRRIVTRGPTPAERTLHSAMYDPVRRRMIIFGGLRNYYGHDGWLNDTWALSLTGIPTWSVLAPVDGVAPARMAFHSTVYDAQTDRMILRGGWDDFNYPGYYAHQIWALSLSGPTKWTQLGPWSGPPPHVTDTPGCALDTRRRRLVSIQPDYGQGGLQVWVVSLAGPPWARATVTGTMPGEFRQYAVAYDSLGDRILLFGGEGYASRVWVLKPQGQFSSFEWSVVEIPGGPTAARRGHNAIWDPRGNRLVIVGGSGPYWDRHAPPVGNETVAIRLTGPPSWETLVPDDPAAGVSPIHRALHGSFYDPVDRRMIILGGLYQTRGGCCYHYTCSYDIHPNDVWGLSLQSAPTWQRIDTQGTHPPGRAEWSVAYDPLRHRAIAYGGYAAYWGQCVHGGPEYRVNYDDRVHVLDLGSIPRWSILPTTGGTPAGRYGHAAVYDPVRDRTLLFGGNVGGLWALSPEGAWSQLSTEGTAPPAGRAVTMLYEPFRDRVLVLGRRDDYSTGAWALSLESPMRWSEIPALGTPPIARDRPGAVYDPIRNRVILDGGQDHNREVVSGSWALTLGDPPRWEALVPTIAPGPRYGQAPVYDPEHDRLLIFGGAASSGAGFLEVYSDTWELVWGDSSLSVGVDIKPGNPDNTVNPRSEGETAVAILGSERLPAENMDLEQLLIAWTRPLRSADQKPKARLTDVDGDGVTDLVVHVDTKRLAIGAGGRPVGIEGRSIQGRYFRGSDRVRIVPPPDGGAQPQDAIPEASAPALSVRAQGPVNGREITVSYSVPRRGSATIEISDLSGRRVLEVHTGDREPGTDRLVLRPKSAIPSGIYFARIRQQGQIRTSKFAVVR